jgi:hypothetical protein
MRGMIPRGDGGDGHLITALCENFSGEIGLITIDGLNLRKTPLAKQFAGGSYAKFWLSIQ